MSTRFGRRHGRPHRKSIMYEMYPDAWPTTVDQRPQTGTGDKPRRRVRKEHSVIPPVLVPDPRSPLRP